MKLKIVFATLLLAGSAFAQLAVPYTNAASTGTTVNTLTKLTGAPSTAVIAATSDTSGIIGITAGGAGTSGTASVVIWGQASCVFDGATTAGDWVQISSTTGGDCHDTTSGTRPTSGQIIGRSLSTNGSGGTYVMQLTGVDDQAGASGAPGGVAILAETATYAGASGDYSSSSAAPSQIIFTLTATGQTYTLLSSAPATGSCVIVENSLASAPYNLGVLTGGSTTLDGTAYTTASSSLALSPGQSQWYCSNGTGYFSQPGRGVAVSSKSNIGGAMLPAIAQINGSAADTGANVVDTFTFVLAHSQLVTNMTIGYSVGVAASTGDVGFYDTAGNQLTHVSGGIATTTVAGTQTKSAASPVVFLPAGTYTLAWCDTTASVTFYGVTIPSAAENKLYAASGSLLGSGTAATACSTGVLPATLGTITISNAVTPIAVVVTP